LETKIVTVEQWHIRHVADNCRKTDKAELFALALIDPYNAIKDGVETSETSWTGLINNVPVCIFGVCPVGGLFGNMGRPWMIGTDLIDQHAITFLRRNKKFVKMMLNQYGYLSNYVDCRNTKAIQWLRWLGFSFNEPEPMGPFMLPFMRFEMRG